MADKRHDMSANPDLESDVSGDVVDFLQRLASALKAKDINTLQNLYEVELPTLTDRHYSTPHVYNHRGPKPQMKHWPLPKYVKSYLGHPQVELLYQLHQFRSQYSDRSVSAPVRKLAWSASEKAFEQLSAQNASVDLPDGWIWDLVEEFLYQLQTHRIRRLRPDQAQGFPANVWSVQEAAARLESVVSSTGVRESLSRVASGQAAPLDVIARGEGHLRSVLGYASLIGIVKLRVLLGDYAGALDASEALGVRSFGPTISSTVPALHVTLYYHVGFAYLMLGRYADAVATLQCALAVKAGNRKFVESNQSQVVALLLVAGTLGDIPPQEFASSISDRSRGAQDDDAVLLAQGDVERFRDVFLRACPKFITAADVVSGTTSNFSETGQEAKELQLRMFLRAVRLRVDVLKLRGYLGAYSTLTNQKVSSLLAASSAAPVEAHLVATKSGSRQRVRTAGCKVTEGEVKRVGVVDFTAEGGNIHVQRHFEQPTLAASIYDRVVGVSA
jgi:translation initiation factor 3 subunit L